MTRGLEQAVAAGFALMVASHLLRPAVWRTFLSTLFQQPSGPLLMAMFTLPIALLLVIGHNDWRWTPAVIFTVYGWLAMFKSVMYLLWPETAERIIRRRLASPRFLYTAHCVAAGVAAGMCYAAFAV